jgi:NAD(P) transhydrogenase subunit alpha
MAFTGLKVGIPRERMSGERRVSATPETVGKLTGKGARVLVEKGAGEGSLFSDREYLDNKGEIVEDVEQIFAESDIILKVKEPLFSEQKNKHEADMTRQGQYLVCFLHPASPSNHSMIKKLAAQGVISLTLDSVPRISRAQSMDALTSMSTVAGYKAVLLAANTLGKFLPMLATAVGMIRPAKVLVIGTGVAGLQSLATAKRLGAEVLGADIRPDACEQAKSLGAKIVPVSVPANIALGPGGYALPLPEEWIAKEQAELADTIAGSDIIILSALVPGRLSPVLISEEMVKSMKAGSVIVDIAIDQGGNCQLSEPGKTVEKHGVKIIAIKNIPGRLPLSATQMYANNIFNFLCHLVRDGRVNLDMNDEIISSCLVTNNGQVIHAGAIEAMKSTQKD